MGHYHSELANTKEDNEAFRKIEEKYATMSWEEKNALKLEIWLERGVKGERIKMTESLKDELPFGKVSNGNPIRTKACMEAENADSVKAELRQLFAEYVSKMVCYADSSSEQNYSVAYTEYRQAKIIHNKIIELLE